MKTCTDEEFTAAWSRFKSAAKVAKALGIAERAVYLRRRRIERRSGMELASEGDVWRKINGRPRLPAPRVEKKISNGVVVVFGDCHYWTDVTPAHLALVKVCKQLQPSLVVANGDVLDGATTSRHHRLGWEERPTLSQELDLCRSRLNEVLRAAPNAERAWNQGNHDNRLDGWLANNAAEVEGLPFTCLQDYFREWPMSLAIHINTGTAGHTVIKHRIRGGIHATRNNTLVAGTHIVTNHLHQCRVWRTTDYRGPRWAVDTGCIAEPFGKQFLYMEENPRDWMSGFAVLTFENGQLLPPELCTVIDGHAYFRGKRV